MQDKRKNLAEERLPPYVPYRQWRRLLDDLGTFTPSRFDASYFDNLGVSVSGRSMLKGALRFFGLMSHDGTPTDRLRELVNSDSETQPEVLEAIVRGAYAPLFVRLDLAHASRGQVLEYFESEGITGDIGRKCWSFFMAIAADARIKLSPQFDRGNRGKRMGRAEKAGLQDTPRYRPLRTAQSPEDMTWKKALLDKFPNFDPDWPDELKMKWFDDVRELSRLGVATTNRASRQNKLGFTTRRGTGR